MESVTLLVPNVNLDDEFADFDVREERTGFGETVK